MQPIFEVTAEICISQCTEYNIAYYFVLQNKRTAYITSLKKSYEISTATIKSLVKANHQESDSGGVSARPAFSTH